MRPQTSRRWSARRSSILNRRASRQVLSAPIGAVSVRRRNSSSRLVSSARSSVRPDPRDAEDLRHPRRGHGRGRPGARRRLARRPSRPPSVSTVAASRGRRPAPAAASLLGRRPGRQRPVPPPRTGRARARRRRRRSARSPTSRWLDRNTVRPSSPRRRSSSRTSRMPGGVEAVDRLVEDRAAPDPSSAPRPGRAAAACRASSPAPASPRSVGQTDLLQHVVDSPPRGCRPVRPAVAGSRGRSWSGTAPPPSTSEPMRGITSGSCAVTSAPSTRSRPPVGLARPSRQRIVVVLPDPLGPRKPKTPPSGTARSSPSTRHRAPAPPGGTPCARPSTSMTSMPHRRPPRAAG